MTDIEQWSSETEKSGLTNIDTMIANIESLQDQISESDRAVCARCKGVVDGQLTKITDIKS